MANERNRGAVQTLVLEETVVEHANDDPAIWDAMRSRIGGMYERQKEESLQRAAEAGLDEATLLRVQERTRNTFDGLISSLDGHARVWALNTTVRIDRTEFIDFANARARWDDKDLRDLDALVREHGLDAEQALALSKSGFTILRGDANIRLLPHVDSLAVVTSCPRFGVDQEILTLGVIPSTVWGGTFRLEVRPAEKVGEAEIEAILRDTDSGHERVRFWVRAGIGHRVTRWIAYARTGEPLREFALSDYRPVGNVLIPFHTELRETRHGISNASIQQRTVRSARVNAELAEGLFEIPASFRVQNTVTSQPVYRNGAVGGSASPPLERPQRSEATIELPRPANRPATKPARQ